MSEKMKEYKGKVVIIDGVKMTGLTNQEETKDLQEEENVTVQIYSKDEINTLINEAFNKYDNTFKNLVDR
ncbi:hypothetical protein [uncultured Marinococcus sp.]|jgi:hypothetical protein|uniref:hypothetical protein n=1 Tax=uncultured Marinococcus sp. TaxID=487012 RepID=UPI00261CDB9A|nr:hypothetical protein [uncultured Marinococcus sp.]